MLVEIATSFVMGGVLLGTEIYKRGNGDDHRKIELIAANCGLVSKDGNKIRIHRKTKKEKYAEYVYQLPLGLSAKQFQEKSDHFQDGLNAKKMFFTPSLSDIKSLKLNKEIVQQIQSLFSKQPTKKEVEISYDGMLKIKVHYRALPESLSWEDSFLSNRGWTIPVGQTRDKMIHHDFDERSHMIVAGATGFGKSQFLKMLITSLVMKKPEDVRLSLIDLKGGTAFQRFKKLKQVENYGKNPEEAREILQSVQEKMNESLEKLVANEFEDVKEAKIKDRHFIVIDEAADIAGDPVCMDIVTDIARRGRGAGYRLIYATQYPTNQTLPSQVRQNIGARICFVLETTAASLAVLNESGAEKLPEIPGRAIYNRVKSVTVQTPYMNNDQIKERVSPHVVIKAREEEQHEKHHQASTEGRGDTLVIEETALSD